MLYSDQYNKLQESGELISSEHFESMVGMWSSEHRTALS